jgi:hypothetical protein
MYSSFVTLFREYSQNIDFVGADSPGYLGQNVAYDTKTIEDEVESPDAARL